MSGYNGWANYPTWVCNLWLTNDQWSHDLWCRMARESRVAGRLEEAIKSALWEDIENAIKESNNGFLTDLVGYSFSEIDWYEIAEAFRKEVDEEEKGEGE
jgi:DNA-directed RNA polymerase beta' subunit